MESFFCNKLDYEGFRPWNWVLKQLCSNYFETPSKLFFRDWHRMSSRRHYAILEVTRDIIAPWRVFSMWCPLLDIFTWVLSIRGSTALAVTIEEWDILCSCGMYFSFILPYLSPRGEYKPNPGDPFCLIMTPSIHPRERGVIESRLKILATRWTAIPWIL